jgi:hypothetical protein
MVLIERNEKTQERVSKLLQKRGGSYFERRAKYSPIFVKKMFYKKANTLSTKNTKENIVVLDLFNDDIFSKGNRRFPYKYGIIRERRVPLYLYEYNIYI